MMHGIRVSPELKAPARDLPRLQADASVPRSAFGPAGSRRKGHIHLVYVTGEAMPGMEIEGGTLEDARL